MRIGFSCYVSFALSLIHYISQQQSEEEGFMLLEKLNLFFVVGIIMVGNNKINWNNNNNK